VALQLQDDPVAWRKGFYAVPGRFRKAAGLLQGLKDADVGAFQALGLLGPSLTLTETTCHELLTLLAPHVLRPDVELQPSQHQHQHQPKNASLAAKHATSATTQGSNSTDTWLAAVSALAAVWPNHCHLMDPDMVCRVLQRVLEAVSVLPHDPYAWLRTPTLDKHAAALLGALLPHSHLVTAVLQHNTLMGLIAAAPSHSIHDSPTDSMFGKLVAASPLPLQDLPVAHGAVCQLLASGTQVGGGLLAALASPEVQQRLGVWQDLVLQEACMEGARRAAAAVASQAGSSPEQRVQVAGAQTPDHLSEVGDDAAVDGGSDEEAAPDTAAPAEPPVRGRSPTMRQALDALHLYGEGMVHLLEGQQSAAPAAGSIQGAHLVAAAWEWLQLLIQGSGGGRAGALLRKLVGSPIARQLLLQQPGGVCSLEEVCGVLVQCLSMDNITEAVEAVVGLLREPALKDAALALPGFVTSVVAHALRPPPDEQGGKYMEATGRLLGALLSEESGRAALLAQPHALGHVAWDAAPWNVAGQEYSHHVSKLWAAGGVEGFAGAMVAGLAASEEGWVKLLHWVMHNRPVQEWCELPGLLPALISAYAVDQAPAKHTHMHGAAPWPLAGVFTCLLQANTGRQLLSSSPQLTQAVSSWLQRTASPEHPSPLEELLQRAIMAAGDAMSFLASSPVLCKGTLVSLLICSSGWSNHAALVKAWVSGHEEVQQQVLGDRGLLCILLRALVAAPSRGEAAAPGEHAWNLDDEEEGWWRRRQHDEGQVYTSITARCVLQQLPVDLLLPQLVRLLAGEGDKVGTNPPAGGVAAAATTTGDQLVAGTRLALELTMQRSAASRQKVLDAMQQLARDTAQVHHLQQVEAAGHAAWVAVAQARQDLAAQVHQEQRRGTQERDGLAAEWRRLHKKEEKVTARKQKLRSMRSALSAERRRQYKDEDGLAAERKQLQSMRDAAAAELQQLCKEREEQRAAAQQQLQSMKDAAAAEREEWAAKHQQLQRERDALALAQRQLRREREEQAGQRKQLQREREELASHQQWLQREREALREERQQLEALREEGGRHRKRRQL
jgi:hypothetical protein